VAVDKVREGTPRYASQVMETEGCKRELEKRDLIWQRQATEPYNLNPSNGLIAPTQAYLYKDGHK
jgi:hypothetical protein